MTQELRVLMIEDSEDDALLLARELKRGDFDLQMERVDSAETVTTAIIGRPWDLVLCDYSMPRPVNGPKTRAGSLRWQRSTPRM